MGIDETQTVSKVLKYLDFPVVSNSDCFKAMDRVLPLNTFCAGYKDAPRAVCKGDSGGGLVFREPIAGSERYIVKVRRKSLYAYISHYVSTYIYILS